MILDQRDQVANECYNFVEETLNKGDSILVHSVKGQSRACTILAVCIMRRYRWSLLKTLEFLNSRRPDLEIRAAFIHQLTAYENRLVSQGMGPKTSKWTEVNDKSNEFENEELLLRNTYLNAQMGPFADFSAATGANKATKLKWADSDSREKKPLASVIGEEESSNCPFPAATATPIIKKQNDTEEKIVAIKEEKSNNIVKQSNVSKKEMIASKSNDTNPQRQKKVQIQDNINAHHSEQPKLVNANKSTKLVPKPRPNQAQIKPKYNNFIDPGI